MNILVLGATGHTVGHVVELGLGRNHRITAYTRSPHKLRGADGLRVCAGELHDVDAFTQALRGQDAVISCLGLPPSKALRPSTFMADSVGSTLGAMQRAGVGRIALLSAAVLFPGSGFQYRFFSWLLKHHAHDLRAMEAILTASDFEWTIARPPRLVEHPGASYQSCAEALPQGKAIASYRSVACFLLDALEGRPYPRQRVG